MSTILHVDNKNFDTILSSKDCPIIIDFWADWCSPCKIFSPIIDEIAMKYKDFVVVAKVNVDDCKEIALKYQIKSIPTLLFLKRKKLIVQKVGVISKLEIQNILHKYFQIA
ncbi:thioredoxin [Buchnera aphidicola]|uniref:thioredoxin n=1 Tax=Buchnera aphidicola TaxID=9 RepID=UPI0031B85CDD